MAMPVGALYHGSNRCEFRVWAPALQQVGLRILTPDVRDLSLDQDDLGYWRTTTEDVPPGSRYRFLLEGAMERPDPASQFQPEGVHGPSEVLDHGAFRWTDAGWESSPLEDMVMYELHVGTFTPEGTFEAVIPRLAELKELGITAVELMPVAQFPGDRNWGYDGAYPYAAQDSYGGPTGLKTLVNAIHRQGMSALLDVVYNHLGPEGCYVRDFGPYFTGKYRTPWGDALNYDEAYSYGVRDFFIENALFWLREYHFDVLRLDALHQIYDQSAKHFLQELAERVGQLSRDLGRKCYLIGESDLDDVRLIKPIGSGGYGLDAQWNDDFHHALHALLTGETVGYYEDFGRIEQLAKAFKEGYVYSWQYSRHRKRLLGSKSRQRPARQFVVFSQNHDQVGNRMFGERSSQLADFESLKLAAGAVLLSPYLPLLFMGQEYAEDAPFLYFVSHTDADLVAAVRAGRRHEFRSFQWEQEVPDPQAAETFQESKLRWEDRRAGRHRILLEFYRRLLALRRSIPHVVGHRHLAVECRSGAKLLAWHRRHEWGQVYCLMNFSDELRQSALPETPTTWTGILDSADSQWDGPGAVPLETVRGRPRATVAARSIAVFSAEWPMGWQEQAAAQAVATLEE
jgi:maltooligosyltrehalose trehalohydrolase